MGDWVDPRADLESVEKRKRFALSRIEPGLSNL
jgi:hypothetical protein